MKVSLSSSTISLICLHNCSHLGYGGGGGGGYQQGGGGGYGGQQGGYGKFPDL